MKTYVRVCLRYIPMVCLSNLRQCVLCNVRAEAKEKIVIIETVLCAR